MQKAAEALQQMYERGQSILAEALGGVAKVQVVDGAAASGWGASAFDLLRRIFPPDDMKVREFENIYHHHARCYFDMFRRLLAVLENAITDLKAGYLFDLRELLAAEVFDDLLEMAEYLIEKDYHLPAASIAGAVLEDALRRLCDKTNVTWSGDSSISKLNKALYKAQAYDKVQSGEIRTWGTLRNQVDHHDFRRPEDVDAKHVKRMVAGIRDFILKHLSQ
ncbi:MAG: hypothetical protein KAW89_08645 [Armatimonadetes bacterium]|nr:hypothetical protein [Armatimonadota bacterium]